MRVRFSRFLEEKEINGMTAVFHRLHPIPLYFQKQKWNLLRNGLLRFDERSEAFLSGENLIIKSGNRDFSELKTIKREYKKRIDQVTTLYLVLTHSCNLRCKYCFIPSSFPKSKEMMSSAIVRKGIDLWASHVEHNYLDELKYFIIFYGGEPLMNLDTLKKGLAYIRKLQRKDKKIPKDNLEIVVISNGLLLDKSIANLFKRYGVSATISLDGPKQSHNTCRKDKKNKGTFKRAIKAIEFLKKEGIKTRVSATITPYNLETMERISDILKKFDVKEFGLSRLVGMTLFCLGSTLSLEEYYQRAVEKSIETFIIARKKGIRETKIQEKIDAFVNKIYPFDCNGYGGQIVVQPNGWISNCQASSRYEIMHINEWPKDLLIKNAPHVKSWRERLPLYNEECLNCEAISICGGGCPWSTRERTGDLFKKDESFCMYTKKLFEFILKEDYEKNKVS